MTASKILNMWKCIFCVILFGVYQASGEYECHTTGKNVTCTALQENSIYDNLTVTLTNEETSDVDELEIADSSIYSIKKEMFHHFQGVEILRFRNTSTQKIEEGAFQDLFNLKKVFLTDNYVKEFNSNVFSSNNSVHTLDLSSNLLINLDNFNVWSLPVLSILNISHNRLEYLPENILNKVTEENKFYLIVDNNPWNCLHPNWVLHLTEILQQAFCTDKTYDPSEIDRKMERVENLEYTDTNKNETDSEISTFSCIKYSLKRCLLWAFGAVWVGIILGNMCKLKRMLFTTPRRHEDKNTQCEKIELVEKA